CYKFWQIDDMAPTNANSVESSGEFMVTLDKEKLPIHQINETIYSRLVYCPYFSDDFYPNYRALIHNTVKWSRAPDNKIIVHEILAGATVIDEDSNYQRWGQSWGQNFEGKEFYSYPKSIGERMLTDALVVSPEPEWSMTLPAVVVTPYVIN